MPASDELAKGYDSTEGGRGRKLNIEQAGAQVFSRAGLGASSMTYGDRAPPDLLHQVWIAAGVPWFRVLRLVWGELPPILTGFIHVCYA